MTDALIKSLSQLSTVSVIASGSVMRYKNPRTPVSQIARELNVDAVVKGSMVRSGTLVRINAQLFRAATDRQIWARSYEHDLSDILRLQTEVAAAIVPEIESKIAPQQQVRLARVRSVAPAAYEAYLKARHVLAKRSEPAVRKGIAYLEQALREDPGYAPAYAALAEAYHLLASPNAVLSPKEASRLATAAAMKALSLDETLAEAHSILGLIKGQLDWDWPSAERELKRAIELNPSDAYAHDRYGGHLLKMKRMDESLVELKLAERLDPVGISGPKMALANWFIAAKQYDTAIAEFRKMLELDPDYAPAHVHLSGLYDQLGMYHEAFAEIQKASELSGSRWILAVLAHVLAHLGRTVEANKIIGEIQAEARHTNAAFSVAKTYAVLGRGEEALQWMEYAYEARAQGMLSLTRDSELDSLRPDPRFQELVRRVGLPQ